MQAHTSNVHHITDPAAFRRDLKHPRLAIVNRDPGPVTRLMAWARIAAQAGVRVDHIQLQKMQRSDFGEVVAVNRRPGPVMGATVKPMRNRRLIGVEQGGAGNQIARIAPSLGFGQEREKFLLKRGMLVSGTREVPDQLGPADTGDHRTGDQSCDRQCGRNRRKGARAKKYSGELRKAIYLKGASLGHVMVERAPQELKPQTAYFGGRTPGGWRVFGIGLGVTRTVGFGGVVGGLAAHLKSPFILNALLSWLLRLGCAGRVVGTRPAPDQGEAESAPCRVIVSGIAVSTECGGAS